MLILFYVAVFIFIIPRNFKRLYWFFGYAGLLISPAVLFLVERANIDIFMFVILCLFGKLAVSAGKNTSMGSYLLLLLGSVLKIYPVFAFASMLFTVNNRRTMFLLGGLVAVLLGLYVYFNFAEFMLISKNTPRSSAFSFGKNVLFQDVFGRLEKSGPLYMVVIPNVCFLAVVVLAFLLSKTKKIRGTVSTLGDNYQSRVLFVCGACVYVGTFFIGNNFNYRLVFLLLTVPMLLEWSASKTSGRIYFGFLASVFFITFWHSFVSRFFPYFGYPLISYFITFVTEQLSNWAILFIVLLMLFFLFEKYCLALKQAKPFGNPATLSKTRG